MIKTLILAATAATFSIGALAQASAPMGKEPMKMDKMEKPMHAASSASGAMMKKHPGEMKHDKAMKPMKKASA